MPESWPLRANHIRYGLINRKGAKMMIYFQRIMLPAITTPVMRDVVDPRLTYSWELIAQRDHVGGVFPRRDEDCVGIGRQDHQNRGGNAHSMGGLF